MHLAYYDEAGDDGYPRYSAPLFVLSALYTGYLKWRANFDGLHAFRRDLHSRYGIPVKAEFHTRPFLLNKAPYRDLSLPDSDRVAAVGLYCAAVAQLDARIVNVCIVKPRVTSPGFKVLDWALKLSVQRIENDLASTGNDDSRFLLITDPGRVGKMRTTTRRVQRINFIPSKFGPQAYRREIQRLIEDPLPKDSRESFFIQTVDLVSWVVYAHSLLETKAGGLPSRLPTAVDADKLVQWMEMLKPVLNTQASRHDRYGIVYHPC